MAKGNRDGVELAPALRHDRRRALRQFGAQPVHLAELLQERLVRLDALRQRDPRGADVGGEGEHFRQRDRAAERMGVVNRELAEMQRATRIIERVERGLAGIQRHRQRQRLEGRTHFEHAGGQAVDTVGVVRLLRIVRIEIRQRHQRHDLAGPDVGDEAGGGLGLVLFLRLQELIAQRVLDAQIDRQFHRPLQPVGGKAGAVQIGQTVIVQPLLHAGDALVVDVDQADQMRDRRAGGIDALVLAQEPDAGNAEAVDVLLLLRRDFALQPDKALARRQPLAHFAGVEIRQRRGQKLDRLVLVDDAARLAEQARRLDVGGQHLAVAVDDIGPCGRDRILRRGAARAVAVGADGKHHQASGEDGVDGGECQDRKPDAGAGLGGAIDIAPVEQAADQPLPPRLRGLVLVLVSARSVIADLPADLPLICRRGNRAGHGPRVGGRLDGVDHRADRVGSARLCKARRPLGQILQAVVLRGVQRLQPEMAIGEALQPQRRIELGPFRAQRRDRIALLADFRVQAQHALDARGRFHLDPVNIGRREDQHADDEKVDDAHGQPPLITSASTGHAGSSPAACAGAAVRSAGAQLCRTRARIGGNFGVAGRNRALGQDLEARCRLRHLGQMPRAAAGLAARVEEILDDAVFQRMKRHHDQPAARLQHALRGRERQMQLVELGVDENPQTLERPRRRMNFVRLGMNHLGDDIGQRLRGRDRRFLARGDDGAGDGARIAFLAEDVDDVGEIGLGGLRHHIRRGRAVMAHPHVERAAEPERKAALGLIELHRGDADVHHDAVDAHRRPARRRPRRDWRSDLRPGSAGRRRDRPDRTRR